MEITKILRRIWLFSANKIKSSEFFSKQPTQLIVAAHNCHIYLPLKSNGFEDPKMTLNACILVKGNLLPVDLSIKQCAAETTVFLLVREPPQWRLPSGFFIAAIHGC